MNTGTRLFRSGRLLYVAFLRPGFVLPLLEMHLILKPIAAHRHVHIFRRILGRASAKAVQPKRKLIVFPFVGMILAARVHFTENKLPVVAVFSGIKFNRHAAPAVLHFDGAVLEPRHRDHIAEAFSRFVDRVGQDFKYGVLAALQPVRAENHPRSLAHTVSALERGDTVVAILGLRGLQFLHSLFYSIFYYTQNHSFRQVFRNSLPI